MKIFRKISFLVVSLALVMLAAHSLLPHHHGQGESIEACCAFHHSTSDSFAAEESHNHGEFCGLSHNFTLNQEDIFFVAPCVVLERFLLLQAVRKVEEIGYDVGDAPLLKFFVARSKPLRAPPVVFC